MIPTALLIGLVIGRLWVVPITAALWVVLLGVGDSCLPGCGPPAFAVAAVNTAVGVLAHKASVRMPGGVLRSRPSAR
jgi:hypothetical protein